VYFQREPTELRRYRVNREHREYRQPRRYSEPREGARRRYYD
jgi:hypothetical protein